MITSARDRQVKSINSTKNALRRRRISLLSVLLIVLVASAWSLIVNEFLFRGDAVTWYHILINGSWIKIYFYEPVLFVLMSALSPRSFNSYVFWSVIILMGVILFALVRMRMRKMDQLIVILFFCCSFYGIHFILNFQRQCLAIAFFLVAIAAQKRVVASPTLSLLSHHYAVIVHAFWHVGRLSMKAAAIVAFAAIPSIYFILLAVQNVTSVASGYEDYGVDSFAHLAVKQGINIVFVIILLATTTPKKHDARLRSLSVIYLVQCLPTLAWPFYAGFFNRVDYFLFPLLVALWPLERRGWRLQIARFTIIIYTLASGYWWMRLNFGWIVFDRGGTW